MHNSKLHFTLKSLDVYEANRLRKLLKSPYFNVNDTIYDFFEFYYKHLHDELTKEELWQKIHPQTPYDDVRFRKYASDLLKLVLEFFCQEQMQGSTEKGRYMLEAIENKGLEKLYKGSLRSNERLINKKGYKNSRYYLDNYQFEAIKYKVMDYEITNRSQTPNVEDILQNLDAFFL